MNYIPTGKDLEILKQNIRNVYGKVELLDNSNNVTTHIEGYVTDDNYSIDSSSDIRRTYNITLVLSDNSIKIGANKKIWLNKRIRIYIGIQHIRTGKILWYNKGVYRFLTGGYNYDATTNTLQLSCADLFSTLTGDLGGIVSGYSVKIPSYLQDENGNIDYDENGEIQYNTIHDAMVKTVSQLGGITDYEIPLFTEYEQYGDDDPILVKDGTVPYDLEYSAGVAVSKIIGDLRDLYTGYETFFDDTKFICQKIPTRDSDEPVLGDSILQDLIISEQVDVDFKSIKNVTEIWGKCNNADYFENNVTFSNNIYCITSSVIAEYKKGMLVGFTIPDGSTNTATPYLYVHTSNNTDLPTCPIVTDNHVQLTSGALEAGKSYVFKYKDGYWYCWGEYQIGAIHKLVSVMPSEEEQAAEKANSPLSNISYTVDPTNPFCCDLSDGIGIQRQVLNGGEYDNIYSEDRATERAKYETWKTSDFINLLTLEMVEVPWLDVNQKIRYTSQATGQTEDYIINSIRGNSFQGTMTIECRKFQSQYPWDVA